MKMQKTAVLISLLVAISLVVHGESAFDAKKKGVIQAKTAARKAPGTTKANLQSLVDKLRGRAASPALNSASRVAPSSRTRRALSRLGDSLQVYHRREATEFRDYRRGVVAVEPKTGKGSLLTARIGESARNVAIRYADRNRAIFGLQSVDKELVEKRRTTDRKGMTHIVYQQTHEGIPFWGREFVTHLSPTGDLASVNCLIQPTDATLSTEPKTTLQDALAAAVNRLESIGKPVVLSPEQYQFLGFNPPLPVLYYWQAAPRTETRLVWAVEIHPNIIDWYRFFVDAETGKIVEFYKVSACADGQATATATDLLGNTVTLNTYEINSEYFMLDGSRDMFVAGQSGSDLINNPKGVLVTWDLHNNDLGPQVPIFDVKSANNTWNDPTAVSAHYYGSVAYDYFKNTHNRNSLDGKGGSIVIFIHVTENGKGLDNAFWNGAAMIFGDGNTAFEPLAKAIDVAAHEMSHGVIQHTADLEYKFQSGALNESYADVFGVLVDKEDSFLGEDIIKDFTLFPTGALRDMANPHNGGSSLNDISWQPAKMDEFQNLTVDRDNGGVHVNSGIPNNVAWRVIQAIGHADAGQIYYHALTHYLVKQSNFIDARIALIRSAGELYGADSAQQNAVKTAFDQVGITEGTGTEPPPDTPTPDTTGESEYVMFVNNEDMGDGTIDNSLLETPAAFPGTYSQITTKQINLFSARPFALDAYGQTIYFIDQAYALWSVDPTAATLVDTLVDSQTPWSSIAVSPNGKKIALTRNIDENIIVIIDLETSSFSEITLLKPTTIEGEFQDIVRFADAMVWFDNNNLIYDCLNSMTTPGGVDIDFWDVNIVDVNTSQIRPVLPPQPAGVSVGNPTLASRNSSILCVEVFDETSDIVGINLFSGQANVIFNNGSDIAIPNYSVDDHYLVFTRPNAQGTSDIYRIPLKNDKITANGSEELKIPEATIPVWYFYGTPPSVTVAFQSAASSRDEAVTSVKIPVALTSIDTGGGGLGIAARADVTVTVDYTVTGGNAQGGGVDYTLANGTMTFAPGEMVKNIFVVVTNDTTKENNESFTITLSRPVNAWMGDIAAHTFTIRDNDDSPASKSEVENSWTLY